MRFLKGGFCMGSGNFFGSVARRRVFGLAYVALLVLVMAGIVSFPVTALAETLHFQNGGTAELGADGNIRGRCHVQTSWNALMEDFDVEMPDGQVLKGDCIDHNHGAPVSGYYDFVASPLGNGSYSVVVLSNAAAYYENPLEGPGPHPVEPGDYAQRVGNIVWTPLSVVNGHCKVTKGSSV